MALETFTCEYIENTRNGRQLYGRLPSDWEGTAVDLLRQNVPNHNLLLIAMNEKIIDKRIMAAFSVWCAKQAVEVAGDSATEAIEIMAAIDKFAEDGDVEAIFKAADGGSKWFDAAINQVDTTNTHAAGCAAAAAIDCWRSAVDDEESNKVVWIYDEYIDWCTAVFVAQDVFQYAVWDCFAQRYDRCAVLADLVGRSFLRIAVNKLVELIEESQTIQE